MGVIYLRHPVHGEKVESSDLIAAMDRANGWVDFDPSAGVPVAPEVVEPVAALPAFLTAPQEPPKGKKPKG